MPRISHFTQATRGTVRRHTLCLALLVLLTGCASAEAPSVSRQAPVVSAAALQHADQQATAGNLRGAAQSYSTLALDAAPPAHQDLQLRAIDALARAGDFAQAKALLDKVQTQDLDPSYEQRKRLLGARIALAEHQPDAALNLLPTVPSDVPPELQMQISNARASAYEMAGNAIENVRERIRLEALLPDAQARRTNHRAIWTALTTLSPAALTQLRTAPPPDTLSGWMELAAIVQATPPVSELASRIEQWQQHYPKHPASIDIVPGLLGQSATAAPSLQGSGYPSQVAVLLPFSGQYADQAQALRNGVLAAYYRQRWSGPPPQLRFYDTGASDSGMRRYYDKAVKDGAGWVIGPLTKAAVADLAHSGPLSVPVLALNQLEGTPPGRFYQFALAPEDEARQAAERASLDGHVHALAMVPAGDWGARLLQAFTQRFQELGGDVVAAEHYGVNSDFAALVSHLLGQPGAATSSADMLFMVAFPAQARQILAQLNTAPAGALPVYATSHTYSGHAGTFDTTGLDGVIFCDIPWMLSPTSLSSSEYTRSARLWPESMQSNPRLYALGIDAYNIIPYLGQLGDSAASGYPGESGKLYLDSSQRLHRQLTWARYSGNTALPIDSTPLTWTPPAR